MFLNSNTHIFIISVYTNIKHLIFLTLPKCLPITNIYVFFCTYYYMYSSCTITLGYLSILYKWVFVYFKYVKIKNKKSTKLLS